MDGRLKIYIVDKIQRLGYYPKVTNNGDHITIEWDRYYLAIDTILHTQRGYANVTFESYDSHGEPIDTDYYEIQIHQLYQFVNRLFYTLYIKNDWI